MADEPCIACRRPLRYVLTRSGLRFPVDPEPSTDGTVVIETAADGKIVGRILTGSSPEAPGDTVVAYTQHRHTCPHSPDRRSDDTRPLCRSCTLPMGRPGNVGDAALVAAERWTEHPHCDTPAAAARARHAAQRARERATPPVQTELLPEAS